MIHDESKVSPSSPNPDIGNVRDPDPSWENCPQTLDLIGVDHETVSTVGGSRDPFGLTDLQEMILTHDFVDPLVIKAFSHFLQESRHSLVTIVGGFDEYSLDLFLDLAIIGLCFGLVVPSIFG